MRTGAATIVAVVIPALGLDHDLMPVEAGRKRRRRRKSHPPPPSRSAPPHPHLPRLPAVRRALLRRNSSMLSADRVLCYTSRRPAARLKKAVAHARTTFRSVVLQQSSLMGSVFSRLTPVDRLKKVGHGVRKGRAAARPSMTVRRGVSATSSAACRFRTASPQTTPANRDVRRYS